MFVCSTQTSRGWPDVIDVYQSGMIVFVDLDQRAKNPAALEVGYEYAGIVPQ